LAVEGDVVTEEQFGRTSGGGVAEGEEGSNDGRSDGGGLKCHVAIKGGLLNSPDAELAPAGGGHGFDQHGFGLGGGLVFLHERGEQGAKAGPAFLFEDDGAGEESMAECVAGGVFLALGGGGAQGAGAIGA
jgi:hypothetical protein